jgi:NitT/TauT family transport system substrate-binding protein
VVLGLAITAAAGAAAQEPPLTKVRVGYDGFSMTSGPLNYATKKGLFKQFGLDVTPVWVEGGSTLTHAVVGGSIDIAQNGYTPAAAAAVQGADIVFIGGIANKLPFQLVVKSSITSGQQLKGQAIAISRYGSSTDQAAEFALKQLGLARNDVRIMQLGGPATRIAAALSGQIAGTVEQYPDTAEISRHSFHVLVDLTDLAGDYPNTSYLTSRAYLKKNPDTVKRFLMAIATAIHEYKKNPAEAVKLTQAFLSIKDPADATAAYEAYLEVYPDIPRPLAHRDQARPQADRGDRAEGQGVQGGAADRYRPARRARTRRFLQEAARIRHMTATRPTKLEVRNVSLARHNERTGHPLGWHFTVIRHRPSKLYKCPSVADIF